MDLDVVIKRLEVIEVKDGDIIILKCTRNLDGEEKKELESMVVRPLKEKFPKLEFLIAGAEWDISVVRKSVEDLVFTKK